MKKEKENNYDALLRSKRFCKCLDVLNISPIECAERLDNSPAYVYMLQSGQKPISDKTAARIADALNVDSAYIKGESLFMTQTEKESFCDKLRDRSANASPLPGSALWSHLGLFDHLGYAWSLDLELDMTPREISDNMSFVCHWVNFESLQEFSEHFDWDENGIIDHTGILPRDKYHRVLPRLESIPIDDDSLSISMLENGSFRFDFQGVRHMDVKIAVSFSPSFYDLKRMHLDKDISLPELSSFLNKFDHAARVLIDDFLLSD